MPSDLDQALELLVQVVTEESSLARPAYGARVAQRLRRHQPPVDLSVLGLEKFSQLYRMAQAQDRVELVGEPGQDVRLSLPGRMPSAPQSKGPEVERPFVRIRADAWSAFVRVDYNESSHFDRQTRQFHRIPQEPGNGESAALLEVRRLLQLDRTLPPDEQRLIGVSAIEIQKQRTWAREFAGKCADQRFRARLEDALADGEDMSQFMRVLNTDVRKRGAYTPFRVNKVADHIRLFFAQKGIGPPYPIEEVERPKATASNANEESVRKRAQELVGKMAVEDLLELRLPLRVLFPDLAKKATKKD